MTVKQLAAPLVQYRVNMEERLEPGPEAAASPPSALRDRAQAAVVGRVEVQDPIGLAVADRAQHDRLGLQRPGHPFTRSLYFVKL